MLYSDSKTSSCESASKREAQYAVAVDVGASVSTGLFQLIPRGSKFVNLNDLASLVCDSFFDARGV